jgi:hypothetical protein
VTFNGSSEPQVQIGKRKKPSFLNCGIFYKDCLEKYFSLMEDKKVLNDNFRIRNSVSI